MRREGARLSTLLVLVALVGGCASVRPVVKPGPWDRHADSGPLQVFGADPASPGQQVYKALQGEPSVAALLKREGQPDTLQVFGSRWKPKQIVLTYTRKGAGRPRRIVLDPGKDGFVARAPEPLAVPSPAAKRARGPAKSKKQVQAPPEQAPSAEQQLECPIDASRADCQALCKGGARYEWCR